MVHHRQSLPLSFEAGDDFPGVHARLDHLDRHFSPDRRGLGSAKDYAHAPFTDVFEQFISADGCSDAFRYFGGADGVFRVEFRQKTACLVVSLQQLIDQLTEIRIAPADIVQILTTPLLSFDFQCF